jgi:hypothetical protein
MGTKMKMLMLTAILLLVTLFGGTKPDQPGGQCLSHPSLCCHNTITSDILSEPKEPDTGTDSPPPEHG